MEEIILDYWYGPKMQSEVSLQERASLHTHTHTHTHSYKGNVKIEQREIYRNLQTLNIGVMKPHTKEWAATRNWKMLETASPLETLEGTQSCQHLEFDSVILNLNFYI